MIMRIIEIKDMLDCFPDFDTVLGTVKKILMHNQHLVIDLPITNSTACAEHIYQIHKYFENLNRERLANNNMQINIETGPRNRVNDGCPRCRRDNINMVVRLSLHKEDEEE